MSATVQADISKPTQQETPRVAVLSSQPSGSKLVQALELLGFDPHLTDDPHKVLAQIAADRSPIVLCDVDVPLMDASAFLDEALRLNPSAQVILMTNSYSIANAIQAIKRGASDFLPKSMPRSQIKAAVDTLTEQFRKKGRIRLIERQLASAADFHGIVGRGPAMLDVLDQARKMARHYTSMMLTGPTGAGKELLAQAIHQMSPVANQQFVVCKCSTSVEGSIENQLFGSAKGGSSTLAGGEESGPLEAAGGGTVFIDEVGEVPLALQARLLRAIEDREARNSTPSETHSADIHIIAATAQDLRANVLAGRFREDLFCRLSAVQINVPSLAEHREDISTLVDFFLSRYNTLYHKNIQGTTNRAMAALLRYGWPGNVRELEGVISTAALADLRGLIDLADLPEHMHKTPEKGPGEARWQPAPLREMRREHIERVLDACHGNRVRTAQLLGIGRTSLYRYLKRRGKGRAAADVNAA